MESHSANQLTPAGEPREPAAAETRVAFGEPHHQHHPLPPEQVVPGFLASAVTAWPGKPYPLGASWDGEGTNFAIYSEVAVGGGAVHLRAPRRRAPVAHLPAARAHRLRLARLRPRRGAGHLLRLPDQRPYRPDEGLRCNPFKLLVDPYARALAGSVEWSAHPYAYPFDQPGEDWVLDDEARRAGCRRGW
jgi:isoamylase